MKLSDRPERARRIIAARVLRGMERDDLAERFAAEGFGYHDIAKLERGDPKMPLTPNRQKALMEILDLPASWFDQEFARKVERAAQADVPSEAPPIPPELIARLIEAIVRELRRRPPYNEEDRPANENPSGDG